LLPAAASPSVEGMTDEQKAVAIWKSSVAFVADAK
jgi:hypothetical protein